MSPQINLRCIAKIDSDARIADYVHGYANIAR